MLTPEMRNPPEAREAEVREALERALAAPEFAGKRRGELLRYLVEKTLGGEGERLSEYGIALDVFGKPESFDPRLESTIRAEMSRLRKALAEYYGGAGAAEGVRFEFPGRGYAPEFVVVAAVPERPAKKSRAPYYWWSLAAVVLLTGAPGIWSVVARRTPIRSVIVLPFANLTGDPANDHLGDGITEDLTDSLAHLATLRVVARTSAFQFRGKALDIRAIGKSVDADAVIEGSIRKEGDAYRITVQVNRAADGYHILSKVFVGGSQELGRLEREMAGPVILALRPDERVTPGHVPKAEAWDLVLRARTMRALSPGPETFEKTVILLNQAIALDPAYAGAWGELANVYAAASSTGPVDTIGAAKQARAAAARALELEPESADAWASMGYVDACVSLDWKKGEEELRRALRAAPQNAVIHQRLANVAMFQGHFEEALREAKTAENLDPLAGNAGVAVSLVYFMERRYRESLDQMVKVMQLHPGAQLLHLFVGTGYDSVGDYGRALAEYEAVREKFPKEAEIRTIMTLVHAGRKDEARERARKLEAAGQADAFSFAVIYGELGDPDRGFGYLEKAWQEKNCWMLKVYPYLDALRADARFATFLKRANLE